MERTKACSPVRFTKRVKLNTKCAEPYPPIHPHYDKVSKQPQLIVSKTANGFDPTKQREIDTRPLLPSCSWNGLSFPYPFYKRTQEKDHWESRIR